MSKSTRTVLALSLTLGAFGATMAPASANAQTDQVVHPNSACRWETEWQNEYNVAMVANTYGGVYHIEKDWRLLVCGVDRFNLTNTNGLRDLDVRLSSPGIEDVMNPTGPLVPAPVTCEALSVRPDGTIVKGISTTVQVQGNKRLDFNGALDQSVAYGSYVVQCVLPKNVTLINILQREY